MNSEKMFDLADQLDTLRADKALLEERLKKVTADIDDVEYQLSEVMAETETQNFTRAGVMFYLTTKTRASTVAGNKDGLYTALREQGYGDLVYETVNANSLSSFVKEQISENEDALPEWLVGLVNVFEKTSVGVRKVKK